MPNTLVRDAAKRAVNLIPFDAGSIRGDYAAVCSPKSSIPAELRQAHRERHNAYMSGKGRMTPAHGPRYFVTSRDETGHRLIAWVTLDGKTHIVPDVIGAGTGNVELTGLTPTQRRHRDMIAAAWPARFAPNVIGD